MAMRSSWIVLAAFAVLTGCAKDSAATAATPQSTPGTTQGATATTATPASDSSKAAFVNNAPKASPGKVGIKDVKVGTDEAAAPGDTLYVTYTGALENGNVFDSNDTPEGMPFTLELGAGTVIKGWDEGLVGMKSGGERIITIPPDLGYGAQAQEKIPANSTLVFDVKLLGLVKKGQENVVGFTDVKKGTGPAVKEGDTVSITYTGTLVNGKVFDSTDKHGGTPFTFTVGQGTIPGFATGVIGMKKGGERKIVIPPAQGYGYNPPSPEIPPNSILKFDMKLLDIKPKGAGKAGQG